MRFADRSCWSGWVRWAVWAYDLTPGCLPAQFEDLVELLLLTGELGGHAPGPGASPGGWGDQHGLADAGALAEQLADAQVQAGVLGFAAHQVGDLEGKHAGDGVDADVVLGAVVHRAEGDDAGVFHLPEGELGFGLGPVTGDDLGSWPFVVIGDEHVLAEELLFQGCAGIGVDAPGQAQVFRLLAGELPGDYPAEPGFPDDRGDLGLGLVPGPAGLAAAEGGGRLGPLPPRFGPGGGGQPAGLGLLPRG